MPNNIVITGEKYIGKSTIVKKLIVKLNLKPGGFVVGRSGSFDQWLSFYLSDPLVYYENQNKEDYNFEENSYIFAKRDNIQDKWEVRPEIFNTEGVKLLEKGLKDKDIVVMDELGRFELKANKFKQRVFEILDKSKPVLAVLKDEHNEFLDRIRSRDDLTIYRIKKDNQDVIYNKTYEELENIINNKK